MSYERRKIKNNSSHKNKMTPQKKKKIEVPSWQILGK